jgi:hypothetical protein
VKKIFLLIMALSLACLSVLAENAQPSFQDLKEINISMKAEIVKYNAFSGKTLKAIKQWAEDAKAEIHIKGDEYFTELYYKDSPLMLYYKDGQGFQVDNTHYYEGTDEDFYRLLGAQDPLNKYRNIKAVLDAAPNMLENLCLSMIDIAETKKGGNAIKKLVKPAETQVFAVDGRTLNGFWQNALMNFKESLIINSAEESFAEDFLNKLKAVRFEDKCTVRQFVKEDGSPFAWRFNGFALIGGSDKRKTSMTFGRTQEGLYLKLNMPAARGKNKLDINIAGSLKDGKLLTDGNFALRDEENNTSGRFDVSLNMLSGLKGKIDCKIKRKGEKEKRYLIRPALEMDHQNISGKIAYKHSEGDRETSLNFTIAEAGNKQFKRSQSIVKVAGLNESNLALERENIARALSRPLTALISDVAQEQRAVVLHDITRLFRLTDNNNQRFNIPKYTVVQEEP